MIKTTLGIKKLYVLGGMLQFDEDGYATGLFDANGNKIGEVPLETENNLAGLPDFEIIADEGTGNAAKGASAKKKAPKVNSPDENEEETDDKATKSKSSSKSPKIETV